MRNLALVSALAATIVAGAEGQTATTSAVPRLQAARASGGLTIDRALT